MTFRARAALAAILLLFIATAMLFVSRPGIEADESLAANRALYYWHSIPLMLMSYMGALKAWFYIALFNVFKPGPLSLRLPTVLIGAAAVCLFFLLLDRTVGRRAAWIGALLLATDSMFVILEAIDFGPTAFHFVFKLGGMLLLVRFSKLGSPWMLAAAFFLFGLGLWDKAIFAWVLFGISLATLIVFPRELLRLVTIRNLAIALISITIGALPLVMYNIARPLDTLKANVHLMHESFDHKVVLLERTANGEAFFAFLTSVDPPPHPGEAKTWLTKTSKSISDTLHQPIHNLTIVAFCASLLGVFARASRRPVLFGWIACAGTWLPMVLTAGAGGAAHHVILLFPFQFLAIAAALAAISWTSLAAALTILLCASNLSVTNEYYWELVRNGPDVRWTDAIYPLERRLETLRSPNIYIVDWGIFETVNMLGDGSLPVHVPDWRDTESLRKILADPRAAFIAHTPRYAFFPGQRAILEDTAASSGYEEVPIETIDDRNGRPTFDVFRFRKIPL